MYIFAQCFSLLKVNDDTPYQKVIVYVNQFSLYGKAVSLICSLCLCVMISPYTSSTPLPYMVCRNPDSGTEHSLKEVSAYIIWYGVHTCRPQEVHTGQGHHYATGNEVRNRLAHIDKCHKFFSVHFCVYLQIIYNPYEEHYK